MVIGRIINPVPKTNENHFKSCNALVFFKQDQENSSILQSTILYNLLPFFLLSYITATSKVSFPPELKNLKLCLDQLLNMGIDLDC